MAFAETPLDGVEVWPVAAASGPFLAPLELASPVDATPDKQAEKIGYLRIGARVARSDQPVSLRDGKEAWYALRPLGFICADARATLDLEHPSGAHHPRSSPLESVRCRMANGPISSHAKPTWDRHFTGRVSHPAEARHRQHGVERWRQRVRTPRRALGHVLQPRLRAARRVLAR